MLRWLTAGESHGPALVGIIEGVPAGVELTSGQIADALARRRLGYGRGARMKFEQDVVTILTKHAATAALKGDELGTLEPGKLADIVVIDGDPLESSAELLNVVMTIKGGEVVYEK